MDAVTSNIDDVEWYNQIYSSFADAVYNKMVEKRYGISINGCKDIKHHLLEKEKLELSLKYN